VVLKKRQQYVDAGSLGVRALQIHDALLGEKHKTTMDNLAFLRDLSKRAKDKESWKQYYEAILKRRA
jgi:hypothetical protein